MSKSKHSIIKEYIKFYFSAKRKKGHGVHSPFIFELISQVFVKKTSKNSIKQIEQQRIKLKQNDQTIEINDFGSGWRKGENKHRKISEIAKNSLKPKKQAQLLYRIIQHYHCQNILELGTSLGITTTYLALANPSAKVITLEGCPNISKYAKDTFAACKANNIELVIGEFSKTLPSILKNIDKLDIVFFDGNHTKEATLKYFHDCIPHIHNNTMFIFDDIYLSHGMMEAWAEIKKHALIKTSIDIFHMGIIVFRKEMTLEHYKIRF